MDDRHPLAQVLTGGHALWATADVVLAVGTRLQWPTRGLGHRRQAQDHQGRRRPGGDRPHRQARDRPRRRCRDRAGAAQRSSAPSAAGASGPRRGEPRREGGRPRKKLAALAPQRAYLPRDPRRAARQWRAGRGADPGRLRVARALRGAPSAQLHHLGLPGHARLGRRDRARRQACARRRAGGVDQRRRRLHVHRAGARDRGAPSHPAGHRRVQRRRLRQCAADADRTCTATA